MEKLIRTNSQVLSRRTEATGGTKPASKRRLRRFFVRSRKRFIRYSLLATNLALLGVVVFFVTKSPVDSQAVSQNSILGSTGSDSVTGPLDQVSSADIAVHLARTAGLAEADSVVNRADSIIATEATASADANIIPKPQLSSSALPSKEDIQTYTVVAGDTVSSLAIKFGISSDSIRWSNGLNGNTVAVGKQLKFPPAGVNGIVYTVKAGDTPDSLAQKYGTNKDAIIRFNNAEISGLAVGEQIVIPDGTIRASTGQYNYYLSGFAFGNSAIYGHNGYTYGWCTYYAASKVPVPANWGNANTWDSGARASGWIVSPIPRVGAVAQTDRMSFLGHVAYVEAVSEDGQQIKYSDMNGLAGWGRVGYSDWVPASTYMNYIYR